METAQNSENSSPKLLFDNKLRANLVWKYASTFDLIVNLVESDMRKRNKHSETNCL